MADVTQILSQIESGDPTAADQLLPLVYDELRKLAAAKLAHERAGQTFQATALVHEAYLRLVDVEQVQHWNSRGHFFGAAAEAMRRILVEHARRNASMKRGANRKRRSLDDLDVAKNEQVDRLLAINDLLDQLMAEDPTIGEIVKLRVFAGLSINEASEVLGLSRATGFRHWTYARAWLRARMADE
jgi:RNA polymerase sigma factor (TIGR02999 family)